MSPSGSTWMRPWIVRTEPRRGSAKILAGANVSTASPLVRKPSHSTGRSVSTRRACSPAYVTWNSAIAAALGAGGRNLARTRLAAQLVEQQPSRGRPRQPDAAERSEVRRHAAAEVVVDECELGQEHRMRVELDLLLEHEPLEDDALGDVPVADRPCERCDCALADLPGGELADHAGSELLELADRRARRPWPGRRRRARCRDSGRAPRGRRRRLRPCPDRSRPGCTSPSPTTRSSAFAAPSSPAGRRAPAASRSRATSRAAAAPRGRRSRARTGTGARARPGSPECRSR